MKSKLLLALLACCLSAGSLSAQCYAYFSYSQSATSTDVNFYVDSTSGNAGGNVYTWSFGDGSSGTGSQLVHHYNSTLGSYMVCLTLRDTLGGCTFTTCDTVNLNAGHACAALITSTSSDTIHFFNVTPTGTAPYTYTWTVDGTLASTQASPTIPVTPNMLHTVCVSVTDSSGCVANDCTTVFDSLSTCHTYASVTSVGNNYTFTASHTGAAVVSYAWYQDNTLLGTTATVSATLDSIDLANGTTVCVNITDANGCTSTDCIPFYTTPTGGGGCQAYFQIYPDSANGTSGYYSGVNLSSGSFGSNVLWSFGDGTSSTSPYPTHTYSTPGQYIICLTVGTQGTSCYDTYCDSSFYVFKTASGPMTHLSISGPTGITEAAAMTVALYPNPVADKLTITNVTNIDYERIYSLSGQLMLETKATGNTINVSKLGAGIYVLELTAGGATSRAKFVKE